jgi:hypothetical protein
VQAALPGTVYQSGGCSSYYTDVNGRNSFSWPFSTGRLRGEVGTFTESDYLVSEEEPADACCASKYQTVPAFLVSRP